MSDFLKLFFGFSIFQIAVIKKNATICDEKANVCYTLCNITSETLPSDNLASPIPGE